MMIQPQTRRTQARLAGLLSFALLPAAFSCSSKPRVQEAEGSRFDIAEVHEEPSAPAVPVAVVAPAEPGVVDLVICLDTSGSMDGLIESAKQRLWSIVNDFALVEPIPTLRVALLTYGNDGHSEENGWVRVDEPLTQDLDTISERLFALSTNGGTELVGRVVAAATTDLEWSTNPRALKLIVVAGNESADQDTVISFREASKGAITAGIMVNAIYCGALADVEAAAWREVSLLADGHFASIDANNGTVVINTPFDEELLLLTTTVNDTYIPFGASGQASWTNQRVQDSNNFALNSEAAATRAMGKNNPGLYVCGWDLVDACGNGSVKLEEVETADLPEGLQSLSQEELKAYVADKAEQRKVIQAKVAQVGAQREVWLVEERARTNVDESNSFDRVLRDAIRAQAVAKGFQFKKSATAALDANCNVQSEQP